METALNLRRTAPSRTRQMVRWLHSRGFAFTPEQIALDQGFRGAFAVALLVCAALFLRRPELAWAAFAAFWTCLPDPGGRSGVRRRVMVAFLLCSTLVAGACSAIAALGAPTTEATVFALVALCTFAGLRIPGMAMVGTLTSVVAVVAIEQPIRLADAPLLCLTFLGGGALTIILSLAIWPADPCQGARRAVAAVFGELRDMAAEIARSCGGGPATGQSRSRLEADHRRTVRDSIERAWQEIGRATGRGPSGIEAMELERKLRLGDRMFAGLIALSHAQAAGRVAIEESQGRELLAWFEAARTHVSTQNSTSLADRALPRAAEDSLRQPRPANDDIESQLLGRLASALDELAHAPAGDNQEHGVPAPTAPTPGVDRNDLAYALRRASIVLIVYIVGHAFLLPCVQWATMAAVVVTHPNAEISWLRVVERVLGSVAGGVAAVGLSAFLPLPWEQAAVVFPLAIGALALRSVNYTLFVLFLTPLFILVAELVTPGAGQGVAAARALDNVLGSVLALLGCAALWPGRSFARFAEALAEAVEANLHYAAVVIARGAEGDLVEQARKRAGLCSNAAEYSLRCMMPSISGGRTALAARALLAALRKLAGAVTMAHETGSAAAGEQLKAILAEVSSAHRAFGAARTGGVPQS